VTAAMGESAAARLRDARKVIAWGLVVYAAVALVGAKLAATSVGALAVQMVLAEWGAGRLGIAWSDPAADVPTMSAIGRRVARGAGLGFGAALVVVVFALGTRGLSAYPNTVAPSQLAIALVVAALAAARDELLLRGVPLRALRHVCPPVVVLLVCGGAGAAAQIGLLPEADAAHGVEVAVAGLLGVIFAALWIVDKGGWVAVSAHTAWTFGTGAVVRGGFFDLRASRSPWGGGDLGLPGSFATALALLPLSILALAIARKGYRSATLSSRTA